jgi:hypothetical protein
MPMLIKSTHGPLIHMRQADKVDEVSHRYTVGILPNKTARAGRSFQGCQDLSRW